MLLGGEAGLRCGELMALEWTDIDLSKRQLWVKRTEWKGEVTVPKGGGPARAAHFATRRARSGRSGISAAIGCSRRNTDSHSRRRSCGATSGASAARDSRNRGVHVLRHTFCSHLAMRGAPARAIQELAGHKDLTTTQRYMHLSPRAIEEAIRLLEEPPPQVRGGIVEAATGPKPKAGG